MSKELKYSDGSVSYVKELETKVRQQQAEIESLKAEIVTIEKNTDYWADKSTKTLTDEEIDVLASKHLCYQIEGSEVSGVFEFARAILRKAQEK